MEEKSTYMLKYTWVVDKVENVGRKSGKSQNNAPYCISRAHAHTHTAQLHCVRSLSGITIRSSRRCDLPRCNNITRSLVYFLADTKLLPRNYLNRRNEISRPPRKLYPQLEISTPYFCPFDESTGTIRYFFSARRFISFHSIKRVLEEFKIDPSVASGNCGDLKYF